MTLDRADLEGRWAHAHEEDSESELVYRPASFSLPPSRGRSALEVRADGSYVESSPGPTDQPQQTTGTWTLDGNRLILRPADGSARVLAIASVEPDRLVVQRSRE